MRALNSGPGTRLQRCAAPSASQPTQHSPRSLTKCQVAAFPVTYGVDAPVLSPAPVQRTSPTLALLPDALDTLSSSDGRLHLRNYQKAAIQAVLTSFHDQGHTKQLLSLPTGAGKTVIFTCLAKMLNKKTLVLSHRDELVSQATRAMNLWWGDAKVGNLVGKRKQYDGDVLIATVQSAKQEAALKLLREQDYELCIVDEAHHTAADTYADILQALGFLGPNASPNKLLVGVTATPYRTDNKQLGDFYTHLAYKCTVAQLQDQGSLCFAKAMRINTGTDISTVKSRADLTTGVGIDFAIGHLTQAVNTPKRNKVIATSIRRYAEHRKIVAFCCNIKHAQDLLEAVTEEGFTAAVLHSRMTKDQRIQVLQQHKDRQIQILINVEILTEGYDDASIDCIVLARPTQSVGLFNQCIGRGLRVCEGKQDCLILEFTDNCHKLDNGSPLVTSAAVLSRNRLLARDVDGSWAGSGVKLLREVDFRNLDPVEFVLGLAAVSLSAYILLYTNLCTIHLYPVEIEPMFSIWNMPLLT